MGPHDRVRGLTEHCGALTLADRPRCVRCQIPDAASLSGRLRGFPGVLGFGVRRCLANVLKGIPSTSSGLRR
jgi:hypothetical protein